MKRTDLLLFLGWIALIAFLITLLVNSCKDVNWAKAIGTEARKFKEEFNKAYNDTTKNQQ
jgi:hypothetical protein